MDDMLEAAQALHNLRSCASPISSKSTHTVPYDDHGPWSPVSDHKPKTFHSCVNVIDSNSVVSSNNEVPSASIDEMQPQFLSRMSSLPIVDTSIRSISSLYESTKSSSKVVQYSAEMLENNLRPLSKYFQGNQVVREVDEFACRQLDRFKPNTHTTLYSQNMGHLPRLPELDQSFPPPAEDHSLLLNNNLSQSSPNLIHGTSNAPISSCNSNPDLPRYRSRWHQVTAGAVAAAGAGAAVLSEESMKSLRYCLEWLQYATHQLRNHMVAIQSWLSSIIPDRALNLFQPTSQTLTFPSLVTIKLDIANVLRRVIDVVGRYAGNVLRGDARSHVRMFILSLPSRWANLHTNTDGQIPDSFEAERVHAFATEADDILCSIRCLFEQTITTAEEWLSALGRVPFASSLGLVPHHANVIVEPMMPPVTTRNTPNLYPTAELLPSSPMLSHEMANLSLTSHYPNTPNNNFKQLSRQSYLSGTYGLYNSDFALHGQKRRTVDGITMFDTTPSVQNSFCNQIRSYNGYGSSSFTGPALSAESYECHSNDAKVAESNGNCPPSSLKKRKKDV